MAVFLWILRSHYLETRDRKPHCICIPYSLRCLLRWFKISRFFLKIDCLLSLVGILSQLTWIYNRAIMPILTWILEIIGHHFQNTKLNLYIIWLNLLSFCLIFHSSTMSLKGKSLLCIYSFSCTSHAMNLTRNCIIWNILLFEICGCLLNHLPCHPME